MDQFDLFTDEPTEEWVYEALKPALLSAIRYCNAGDDRLEIKSAKDYSSVYFRKQLAFRVFCRNEQRFFGVSNGYASLADPEIRELAVSDKKYNGFDKYPFEPTNDGVQRFSAFFGAIIEAIIDSIQKEFDCCSRVEVCSNEKRCINPNSDLAVACGYRKIMKSGRIFYGKNRNVD